MKIITILGTRPEIIKLSALLPLLDQEFEHVLIHTGQHYDYNMDAVFFEELNLLKPKYFLNIGSHPQGKQTGLMLEKIEEVLIKEKPDLIIVEGDTNTTMAGALAAAKLHIPIMHAEAGCRSFNRQMPEEINRVIVDHISDYLIAPDEESFQHLLAEGISEDKISLLGSTAFDAVLRNKEFIKKEVVLDNYKLKEKKFVLVTLHRAENTDNVNNLRKIIGALNHLSNLATFVFPIHPRTRKVINENKIEINSSIKLVEPQPYLSFLALLSNCTFCISDSGGIQEEALAFNIPCLIPREETEWTRLVKAGKNILMGTNTDKIINETKKFLIDETELQRIKGIKYPYDDKVSKKIVEVIKQIK
ncbi:MAG: UDP-N-acetylglucosamine 2-epimerase (non-hydrolyzing) [Nanoarchaeota archaeon]